MKSLRGDKTIRSMYRDKCNKNKNKKEKKEN